MTLSSFLRVRYTATATAGAGAVSGVVVEDTYASAGLIDTITVLGVPAAPASARLSVNGAEPVSVGFYFAASSGELRFDLTPSYNFGLWLNENFSLTWTA